MRQRTKALADNTWKTVFALAIVVIIAAVVLFTMYEFYPQAL